METKIVSLVAFIFSFVALLNSIYCSMNKSIITKPIVEKKSENLFLFSGGGTLSVTVPLKVGDVVETVNEYVTNGLPYVKGTIITLLGNDKIALISYTDKDNVKCFKEINVYWLRLAPIILTTGCYIKPGMWVKTKKSYNILYNSKILIGKVKEVIIENDKYKCLVEYCNFNDTDILCSSIFIDSFWLCLIIEE